MQDRWMRNAQFCCEIDQSQAFRADLGELALRSFENSRASFTGRQPPAGWFRLLSFARSHELGVAGLTRQLTYNKVSSEW
jgi:hypothetical protein